MAIVLKGGLPVDTVNEFDETELVLEKAEYPATNSNDTLFVPYTYWWCDGGPFIGLCGDKYALAFTGIINEISIQHIAIEENIDFVCMLQKGIIELQEIKFDYSQEKEYPEKKMKKVYGGEKYFQSDCFYGTHLKKGDTVMVFVYDYENNYCIPEKSILKVKSFDDPIILSIEKYIKNNFDPLCIANDTALWNDYNSYYANHLKQIIDCKLWMQQEKF
jgi:hypothetical protein